jgi:lysophospholipase L1-like esterase
MEMNSKRTAYILTITNILTGIALLVLAFHYDVPRQIVQRIGISSSTIPYDVHYKYSDNPGYAVRRSLFKVYRPTNIKTVMLGDSITYEADWNELLSRNDIANRGIGSDITEGFLGRLSDIYTLNPEVCFIMGGINDIGRGIPVKTIFANYTNIIKALKDNNIRPVIQSTLHVSTKQHNWKGINRRVDELNALLKEYAQAHGVSFIDVNSVLSVNGALKSSYTYDGIHLLGNGYDTWKELIAKELSEK